MKLSAAIRLVVRALIRRDEFARYTLAERVAGTIYPKYKFSEFGRTFLDDAEFLQIYESFHGHTNYRSIDRKFVVDQLSKVAASLEGDTAECGVFQGATSYLTCRRIAGLKKSHYAFDSFEGLSQPGSNDGAYWAKGNMAVPVDIVRRNLSDFDFVEYKPGWIPSRFHEVANRRFCFVHIDVDLYQPTLDSYQFFYPRLVPGGVLLCDDYGFASCPGARQAIDEFFRDKPEQVVHLPTGQALVFRQSIAAAESEGCGKTFRSIAA